MCDRLHQTTYLTRQMSSQEYLKGQCWQKLKFSLLWPGLSDTTDRERQPRRKRNYCVKCLESHFMFWVCEMCEMCEMWHQVWSLQLYSRQACCWLAMLSHTLADQPNQQQKGWNEHQREDPSETQQSTAISSLILSAPASQENCLNWVVDPTTPPTTHPALFGPTYSTHFGSNTLKIKGHKKRDNRKKMQQTNQGKINRGKNFKKIKRLGKYGIILWQLWRLPNIFRLSALLSFTCSIYAGEFDEKQNNYSKVSP